MNKYGDDGQVKAIEHVIIWFFTARAPTCFLGCAEKRYLKNNLGISSVKAKDQKNPLHAWNLRDKERTSLFFFRKKASTIFPDNMRKEEIQKYIYI